MGNSVRRASVSRLLVSFAVCFLVIFAMLAIPLRNIHVSAQDRSRGGTGKEISAEKGERRDDTVVGETVPGIPSNSDLRSAMAPLAGTDQGAESEPNDTFATADPLTGAEGKIKGNSYNVTTTVTPATIGTDPDWYSFTTSVANSKIYAATQTSASGGGTDTALAVFASDGTTLLESDDQDGSFGANASSIAGTLLATPGTYYLRVTNLSATAPITPYDLYFAVRSGATTPETEPNNNGAPQALPVSQYVNGAIDPVNDTDTFTFSANAGDTVFLSLDLDPERDGVTYNGRIGLGVVGTPGTFLVSSDGGTGDTIDSEALFMTVRTTGTYQVYTDAQVAGVGGPTATYAFSVTTIPAASPASCTTYTNSTPTPIADLSLTTSSIAIPDSNIISSVKVVTDISHTNYPDLDVHLRSPSGNDNGLYTDVGAATQTGAQVTRLDDASALPEIFTIINGVNYRPEIAYRLNWYNGENSLGTWNLDIRDDTTANTGTLNSWSLEVCSEPAPTGTVAYSEDFEAGNGGYTHSGTADEWAYGTPATAATTTANPVAAFIGCASGSNCWKTDLTGTYEISSNQELVSPSINLTSSQAPISLSWQQRYQMESNSFDHIFLRVSEVGNPANSRVVWHSDNATMSDGVGNPIVNIGASAGWGRYNADISDFAGKNVQLTFHLDSDTSINFGGWALDDVVIRGTPPSADLSITKNDGVTTTSPGGSLTYTIVVSNPGPSGVTGATVADTFPASLTVTGWTCAGAGGGTCTGSGSGNINDTAVNLPAGSSVTYTANATVSGAASGSISNTATVSSTTSDPIPGNNSATDTDTVVPAGPTCSTAGPIEVLSSTGTAAGVATPYANLGAAFTAINTGLLHTGSISVKVCANSTEPGTAVLNSSGAGAASYTSIQMFPVADGLSITGASAQGRGLIELNGADNVTIDGDNAATAGINRNLSIVNNAANTTTFTSVIRIALAATIVTSADNDVIKNVNVVGSSPGRNIAAATSAAGSENTTFGIFAGPGASTVDPTTAPAAIASVSAGVGAGATAANLLIQNNRVVTAARAISMNGSATSVFPGLLIKANTIGNPVAGSVDQVTSIGITVQGSTNAVVSLNTVYVEGFVASSVGTHAIEVGVNSANVSGTTIEKNRVSRVRSNEGQTWSAYGINLAGGSNHVVQNNFVFDVRNDQTAGTGAFSTTFGAFGIRVASGTGHKVLHNSVHLFGVLPGAVSTDLIAAFTITSTAVTGADVRNNIFSNVMTGGNPTQTNTRLVAINLPSGGTSAMNLTLNNNDYVEGTDPNSRMAYVGTSTASGEFTAANFDPTSTAPATNFRAYTSTLSAAGTNDNASKKVNPLFVSNTDLHLQGASPMIDAGAAVGVVDDIDGNARPFGPAPDIGADEVNPTAAGVTLSGRVLASADGRGLTSARVTLTDMNGTTRNVITGRLGTFSFEDVEVGHTYTISVGARKYSFTPITISVVDNVADIIFTPSTGRPPTEK